jgi:hypothetical protein
MALERGFEAPARPRHELKDNLALYRTGGVIRDFYKRGKWVRRRADL